MIKTFSSTSLLNRARNNAQQQGTKKAGLVTLPFFTKMREKVSFLSLIVATLFLESCAAGETRGSYQSQTQRNYNRDLYECEREATFAGRDNKQQVFDNCMKARGYKQK
jgi:hypothetical protein